ncbi:MAG: hypothetical protein CL926_11820 [Deltaproteobacteria bacterium]|nr:hypothetical protein [Deltaproteobacteria bacterium]
MAKLTLNAKLIGMGEKLGVNTLTPLEAGGIEASRVAEDTLVSIYAEMYNAGIRPTDYLSPTNKLCTATEKEYEERGKVAALAVYNPKERKELATKLPKGSTAEAKAARSKLQNRRTDHLKTVRRGLITQDKLHNPEAYKKGAEDRKEAIEKLGDAFTTVLKILQGDGLPEWFNTPDCTAVVLAAQKTYKIPAKVKNIDDLL